jgi:hypothetical protein
MSNRSVEGKTPLDALGVGELLSRGGRNEGGRDKADDDGEFRPHRSVGVTGRETITTEKAGSLLVCELILIILYLGPSEKGVPVGAGVDTGAKAHYTAHSTFGWS